MNLPIACKVLPPALVASARASIRVLTLTAAALAATLLAAPASVSAQNFYVGNFLDNSVDEYTLAKTAPVSAFNPAGVAGPIGLVLSGNTLYVANHLGSTLAAFDATTGAPIAGFSGTLSNSNPWGLVLSGNVLYVSFVYANLIEKYDATTGADLGPAQPASGLNGPTGIALSGNNIYVSNFFGGTVGAYDLTTGNPTDGFTPIVSPNSGLGPTFLLISGTHLYAGFAGYQSDPRSNTGGMVMEYDLGTGTPIGGFNPITGLMYPTGMQLVGDTLYVADAGTGTIGSYDATGGGPIGSATLPAGPNGVSTPYGLVLSGTNVPGTANPWLALAGATDGSGDSIPAESPAVVAGVAITPGSVLSFGVMGSVSFAGYTPTDSPDGNTNTPVTHAAENGIGGISAYADCLVGVFTNDNPADPTNASVPPSLDFTDPVNGVLTGVNYVHLDPAVGQVFFIGSGKNSSGVAHTVTVPVGATHLVLGSLDGTGWYNNTGAFNVIVTVNGTASTPLTATTLKVDGSAQSSSVPKGEAITFTATQGTVGSGVYVKVQSTTTPTVDSSWTDLADTTNGGAGYLLGDGSGNYTLKTTQYPFGLGIFFRAVAVEGQIQSISNDVGDFNLASANAPSLFITETGSTADDPNANVAIIGDQITYTLKVYNDGPPTANNVKVTFNVPAGQQLVSVDDSYVSNSLGDFVVDIGSLNPTGNSPLLLHVVTTVTSTTNLGQVFSGLGYSVSGNLGAFAQGTDTVTTTVVRPLEVVVVSNSSSVSPGQPLVFQITIHNRTGSGIKNAALSIPIPGATLYTGSILTDDSGKTLTGPLKKDGTPTYPVNPVLNGTNLLVYLGNVAAGAKDHLTVTLSVPYDTSPSAAITLVGPQVTTKTPVGDANSFTLPDTSVTLSSQPPANPPHFTLDKFIPDGTTIFELIGESAEASAYFQAAFPTLLTTDGIQTLATLVNPNVLEITDPDDGTVRQCVYAPGQVKGPATSTLTYGLLFSNDGGFPATSVVLTDRIPAGTQFDPAFPPTYKGKPFAAGAVTLESDGRTIHFNLGTIQPDKFKANGTAKPSLGLVLYTVDVLPNNQGGPSLGATVQAQGGSLATPVLLQTTYAQPNEIDTTVVAPGAAYLESYKGTAQAVIGQQTYYDIFYQNTGAVAAKNFVIEDPLPAGTSFVSADFLDLDHEVATMPPAGATIDRLHVGDTSGTVVYHLGKLGRGKSGFVRLKVNVENSAASLPGLLVVNNPFVPASAFPGNPQRARTGPQTRDTASASSAAASSTNASRVTAAPGQPAIPHLAVTIQVPASVKAGETYDCLVCEVNTTDALIAATSLIVAVPKGATFVSGSERTGLFQPVLHLDLLTGVQTYVEFPAQYTQGINVFDDGLDPHEALTFKVTFRAPSGVTGKTLVTAAATGTIATSVSGVNVAPAYSPNISTYVYDGVKETFADAASQIVTSALELQGSSAASLGSALLQKRIAQLTPTSLAQGVGGTDFLALNNNTVAIQMLSTAGGTGRVLVMGPATNLQINGGASLSSQDGSSIVAQGGGNLITAQNLIGEDGSGIVAQGGGNFQALFAGIVAQGGGNIVAQGGGNIVAQGGGNLISQDGFSVVSNDGGSLSPLNVAGIVAQGGGNIVAAGGGNIVAQGGGNIVAQGGGNIVAQGAGNIVAAGGGNLDITGTPLLSTDISSAISLSGAGIVAAGGGNIAVTNAASIVAAGGGNVVGPGRPTPLRHLPNR